VSGIAGTVWSAIKSMINSAISKLNSALTISISLPGPDINFAPNIPYLARGTNFHRGGLAVVGEQGPELVNLPRGSKVTPNGESMGSMRTAPGGGDIYITTITQLDGREIHRSLIKRKRTIGTNLGLA